MIGRSSCDKQYQITKEFTNHILKFLKSNNISFEQFAKKINVNEYLLYKVIHPKIKMKCYFSLLKKMAVFTQANAIVLGVDSPTLIGIRS